MGTPLQVERPFPSISPYSQNDSHVSTSQQQATPAYYDSINDHPYGHMFSSPFVNPPRPRTNADASTKQTSGMGMMSASLGDDNNISGGSGTAKRTNKTHVPSACVNCKRAHLACDISRPCKRCVALGKVDTCIDIKHKKRGRPKLKDKKPHPYNTHATADAKTWGSNAQFLPPTTTNPNQPSLHQQNDQPPPPPSNSHSFPSNSHTFPSNSHAFPSRHNLQHNHHHRQHPYVIKSPSIPRSQHLQQEHPPTITMFLTIDSVVCARVSEECLAIMGYYPLELVHQSLYNYVHPQDIERVQKMVSSLFEDANRYYNQSRQAAQYPLLSPSSDLVTTDDPGFLQTHPETLQYPAGGGPMIETSDMIHMKQRIGQYDLFDVRMYLGGGLGANLTRRETWNKLYVVAFFTRVKQGTCLTNEGSNYQSRMNVGGFSTPITSPPASTIDPALLTMQHNASPSLGVGRSGLISPILSPRQVPEIGSTSLYGEVNHPIPIFHRKSLQDHETFVSRPNPMISTVSRPESFVSPSTTIPISYERRSSFRSTCDGTLSAIPFYNEMESKALDIPSYANQSNRSHHYSNAVTFNHGDIRSSPSLNNSFPKFQNDEVVEEMIMPPMPRASSSRVGTVGDDSIPTRMSVNSLLC